MKVSFENQCNRNSISDVKNDKNKIDGGSRLNGGGNRLDGGSRLDGWSRLDSGSRLDGGSRLDCENRIDGRYVKGTKRKKLGCKPELHQN